MSLVPFSFNNTELFTVMINGKPWIRAKELCRALEYKKTTKTAHVGRTHCSSKNIRHIRELKGVLSPDTPLEWPRNSQPDEYYINEEGIYELLFISQQGKARAFRKLCCNEMFPQNVNN